MRLDYSYSQPSQSEDYYGNSVDCPYSETEDLIRQDQAELSYNARAFCKNIEQWEIILHLRERRRWRLPCMEVVGRGSDGRDES